jgi:hypothetical protein
MFLIDGSHSTGTTWGGGTEILSESIIKQTNQFILDLVVNAVFDDGEIRDRIKLSAFIAQGEEVNWALEVEQPSESWLSSEQWANSGRKIEGSKVPLWIEYSPAGKTPLFKGWSTVKQVISHFKQQHPNSSVFLVTLTDGDFKELLGSKTDSEKNEMVTLFDDLTEDENFTHLVVHISPDEQTPLVFPSEAPDDEFGRFLFDISTWMPSIAFDNAIEPKQNRRAYVLNADPGTLSRALELGSKIVYQNPMPIPMFEGEEE